MTPSPAHQFDDLDEELAFQAGFRAYCKRERDREFLRELAAGLTGVVHGPPGVVIPFVVDAVDEVAHTWSWHVHVGPLRVDLEHEVLATSTGGSATTLVVDGPLPVALLYPEVARIALSRLVAR